MKKTTAKNNLSEPNTLVFNIPHNSNLVSSKWVFKYKKDDCGNIIKRIARLVARGFSQKYGIDHVETFFFPTLKQDLFRLIAAMEVQKDFSKLYK